MNRSIVSLSQLFVSHDVLFGSLAALVPKRIENRSKEAK